MGTELNCSVVLCSQLFQNIHICYYTAQVSNYNKGHKLNRGLHIESCANNIIITSLDGCANKTASLNGEDNLPFDGH